MSRAQAPFFNKLANRLIETQQTQSVADRYAVFTCALRCFFLCQMKFLDQPVERGGLLDGIQILALQIFDECDLDGFLIRDVMHDRRDAVQAGKLRCAPTAFAGKEFVTLRPFPAHDDGLNDASLANGIRELIERFRRKSGARLVGARVHEINVNLQHAACLCDGLR